LKRLALKTISVKQAERKEKGNRNGEQRKGVMKGSLYRIPQPPWGISLGVDEEEERTTRL